MIAFRDEMPLVEFQGGEVAAFERAWLIRRLLEAAQQAGYPQWWLAEHVAESVACHLRERFDQPVVALPRLAKAVRAVLEVIGYAEVAAHFVPGPAPVKVSLAELAHAAGSGYELAFFDLLGRTVGTAVKGGANYCEFFGLERCVRQLRSRKIWSRDCAALRAEIVAFIREHIGGSQTNQAMICALS